MRRVKKKQIKKKQKKKTTTKNKAEAVFTKTEINIE